MIRYGKGGKSRMVFMGRKTRRALRSYLRTRQDQSPALFISLNFANSSVKEKAWVMKMQMNDEDFVKEPLICH